MISAEKYGQALFSLAADKGTEDATADELRSVREVFGQEPRILDVLDSPVVSAEERHALIDRAFAGFSDMVRNTLFILCDEGAIRSFGSVWQAFSDEYDRARNICRARLVTAVPATDEQIGRIILRLERTSGKAVVLEQTVDPEILGGAILDLPDRRIDMSVRSRLRSLKETMTETIS